METYFEVKIGNDSVYKYTGKMKGKFIHLIIGYIKFTPSGEETVEFTKCSLPLKELRKQCPESHA